MLDGLISIAGGILAASALIVARKPNAKELINKLTPYTGWIGVVMFIWGIWGVINIFRFLGVLTHSPLLLLFAIGIALSDLAVGFLLGFGLITKYTLSGSAVARARGDNLRAKLVPYQATFGIIAIIMGVLYILWTLTH
ncbi:MAG: hypothetical protein WKG01_07515 [Kofleriaceae bacterium]